MVGTEYIFRGINESRVAIIDLLVSISLDYKLDGQVLQLLSLFLQGLAHMVVCICLIHKKMLLILQKYNHNKITLEIFHLCLQV